MSPGSYYPQRTEGGWADLEEVIGPGEVARLSSDYVVYLADLVDPVTHEMWEIMHPSDDAGEKFRQVSRYVARANFHCNPPPAFIPGSRLTIQFIPDAQRPLLIVTPITAGLLQYRYGQQFARVPAQVRDRALEELLESVRARRSFVMSPELQEAMRAVDPPTVPAANPQTVETARQHLATAAGVVTAATVATVVIRSAAWRHFWRAVAIRFAARGSLAVLLASADGPIPVGDALAAGLTLITLGQIINEWSSLWARAEVIAQNET